MGGQNAEKAVNQNQEKQRVRESSRGDIVADPHQAEKTENPFHPAIRPNLRHHGSYREAAGSKPLLTSGSAVLSGGGVGSPEGTVAKTSNQRESVPTFHGLRGSRSLFSCSADGGNAPKLDMQFRWSITPPHTHWFTAKMALIRADGVFCRDTNIGSGTMAGGRSVRRQGPKSGQER